MQIETKELGPGITVMEMSGRFVLGRESQRAEWQVDELLKQDHKKIVFDMAKVDYIDSAGLGIVVGCSGKAKNAGGELRVAGPNQRIAQIFHMTGLDKVLAIYPDTASAVANFEDGK